MRNDDGKRRPETRLQLYAERWLFGSTRSEMGHDSRGLLTDFLCLAAMNGGEFEIYDRGQTARQLNCDLELLNRTLEICLKTKKLRKKYLKREKKEVFSFTKWEQFQPSYLWKRPDKMVPQTRGTNDGENDASLGDIRKGKEKKVKISKVEERRGEQNEADEEANAPIDNPHKANFLSILIQFSKDYGYPYDPSADCQIYEYCCEAFPNTNLIKELEKKIEYWKENPGALNSEGKGPREQLVEFFGQEEQFQASSQRA